MQQARPHHILPVLSLLLSATLWGLVWYPLRLLEAQGLQGLWLTLASYTAALALGLAWLWRGRHDWRAQPVVLLLMTLAVGWCNVAFVLAVLDGTVVRVLLLFYLSPLWALVLGWVFLREHPGSSGLLVFLLAIAGAVTMLWDTEMGMPWPRDDADWLAVSSGFAFALSNVFVRKLQQVGVLLKSVSTWAAVVLIAAVWIVLRGETSTSFRFHHTIYSGQELKERLEGAGFHDVRLYGDLDGGEYGIDATRLVAVARKGTRPTARS